MDNQILSMADFGSISAFVTSIGGGFKNECNK